MFKYPNETNKQASNNHITVNLWLAKLGRAELSPSIFAVTSPSCGPFHTWRLEANSSYQVTRREQEVPRPGAEGALKQSVFVGGLSYTVKGRMSRWTC